MRRQPRKGNGRYTHSSWYNFKKKKRGWKELACHPFTAATFALLAYLTMGIAQAMEEYKALDGKIEIYKLGNDLKFRDSVDQSSLRGTASEDTGETVSAVSEEPRESEEGGNPLSEDAPASSVEAKILKAWEGTGEGHIAVAVFKCESGYDPNAVGDENLTFYHNGQIYGRSIGIAQIRTGGVEKSGRIWVASDNATEFEEKMKNPDENLKVGRVKYDSRGWFPWFNCAKKVGAIK